MEDSVTYQYDEAGRLKLITYEDGTTVEVLYDDDGNRLQVETTLPE